DIVPRTQRRGTLRRRPEPFEVGVIEEEVVGTCFRRDGRAFAPGLGDLVEPRRDRDVDHVQVAARFPGPEAGAPDRFELRGGRPGLMPACAIGPARSAQPRSEEIGDVLVLRMYPDDASEL